MLADGQLLTLCFFLPQLSIVAALSVCPVPRRAAAISSSAREERQPSGVPPAGGTMSQDNGGSA